jgi:hypothetical protein
MDHSDPFFVKGDSKKQEETEDDYKREENGNY